MAEGGSAKRKQARDKEMAARLKRQGDHRRQGKCPVCGRLISLSGMFNHIATHG